MTVYIMTRTTIYHDTHEVYTYASAHATKYAARYALTSELLDLAHDVGLSGFHAVYACVEAYRAGRADESHDAIFGQCDSVCMYGDIIKSEI